MPKRIKKYEDSLIESLKDPIEAAAYLNAHLDEDEPEKLLLNALREVACAQSSGEGAQQASLGSDNLYTELSNDGSLKFLTLRYLLKSGGLKLVVIRINESLYT